MDPGLTLKHKKSKHKRAKRNNHFVNTQHPQWFEYHFRKATWEVVTSKPPPSFVSSINDSITISVQTDPSTYRIIGAPEFTNACVSTPPPIQKKKHLQNPPFSKNLKFSHIRSTSMPHLDIAPQFLSDQEQPQISVLCWRMLTMDFFHRELRFKNLCSQLKSIDASLVFLLNVNKQFVERVSLQPWIQNKYKLSPIGKILVLSKTYVSSSFYLPFSSTKSKKSAYLLTIGSLCICALQLEELGFQQVRSKQILAIIELLKSSPFKFSSRFLLLGDFQAYSEYSDFPRILMKNFIPIKLTGEEIHSYNPVSNPTCKACAFEDQPENFDRAFFSVRSHQFRGKNNLHYTPISSSLVGNKLLSSTSDESFVSVCPSDHYGLLIHLTLEEELASHTHSLSLS